MLQFGGSHHTSAVADLEFSPGVCLFIIFAENCMKMKEFGPGGGARVTGARPWIRQCSDGSRISERERGANSGWKGGGGDGRYANLLFG